MAFTQITVTGSFQTPAGAPAVGTVGFTPVAAMRNAAGESELTVESTVVGTLVDGELSVSLAATDDPGTTPTGVTYAVREYILGKTRQYFIEVPHDGGPIDLGTVPIATPVTPAMAAYLTQEAADELYEPLGGGSGPGGAVDSVNGQTGDVELDAADVGAAATSHTHDVDDINATGTPSSSTYLRGDGSWSTPAGGGEGGAVDSVNGQTGTVNLDAGDVDADPAGTAAAAIAALATVATSGDYDDLTGKPAGGDDVIYVESFRAAGTDLATLQAAFATVQSGQTIRLGQGRTYTLASTLSLIWSSKANITIDFNGAEVVGTGNNSIFTVSGEVFDNATTLAADAPVGALSITTATAVTIVAGDYLQIEATAEVWNPDRTDAYFKGELARVASASGTTITLESPILYGYSTATTVNMSRVRPVRNITILDPRITGANNDGLTQLGLSLRYFDGITVVRPHVKDVTRVGINSQVGYNLHVADGVVAGANEAALGYGYRALGVDGVTFQGCVGTRNRHSFDTDSPSAAIPINARNVRIIDCDAVADTSAGFSTHGGTDTVLIQGCTARYCGGGFIVRGPSSTLLYNRVIGSKTRDESGESYRHAFSIGDDSPHPFGLGLSGVDLVMEHNTADITNARWATDEEASCGIYCTARLVNVRITNNRLAGFSSHGMFFKGDGGTNIDVTGNHLDCSGQTGTANGMLFDPANSTAFTGLRIKTGNRIVDSTGTPIKIVGDTDASTGVEVLDNAYPGWTTGDPVDITAGTFTAPIVGGAVVVSDGIRQLVQLTQSEYDALDPTDPNTLYVVVD